MLDMTACAHTLCLYISGGYDKCVQRVSQTDVIVPKWLVNDVATCLSVTDTRCVLLTCASSISRSSCPCLVNSFIFRNSPQDVVSLWHTNTLSSGELVVWQNLIDNVHTIFEVSSFNPFRDIEGIPKL